MLRLLTSVGASAFTRAIVVVFRCCAAFTDFRLPAEYKRDELVSFDRTSLHPAASSPGATSLMDQLQVVNFYKVADPATGYLSNFYRAPFTARGQIWQTSEHYFQAQKFAGTPYEEHVRGCSSAMTAAREGRRRDLPLRSDWEAVKDDIMLEALEAKFGQNPDLAERLLATGEAALVEHTANDSYWGDGLGSGRNMLGQLLMRVRALLQQQRQQQHTAEPDVQQG